MEIGQQGGTATNTGGSATASGGTVTPTGGGQTPGELKFSQLDLDAIISDRLSRQKAQFADYDALKQKATQFDAIAEAQKTETQKLTDARVKAEQERDAALKKATDRLIRAAFVSAAAKAGAAHPEDVFALADVSGVSIDDSDNVVGVDAAVEAVVKAGRVPLAQRGKTPSTDAGAGGGQRASAESLTPDEVAMAKKLGLKADDYAASKAAIAARRKQET
jgi:hypothetical protein